MIKMNLSILSPEILICEEADWSDENFQIKFYEQLNKILSFFEQNKDKTKIAISTELLNLLWLNSPWNNDCWSKKFFRSKNYGEIFGDLKRVSICYDKEGKSCTIIPEIFSVSNHSICENLKCLLHILLDESEDISVLVGFNNQIKCDKIVLICECHKNKTYDVFTIETYSIHLKKVFELSYRLTSEQKNEIKVTFKNWKIKPDVPQNKILENHNLLFEHRGSGYGRIFFKKDSSKYITVSCTPGANNAGKNIALDLIDLIENVKKELIEE